MVLYGVYERDSRGGSLVTDVVVRRGTVHGMSMDDYAAALRDRLSDGNVTRPATTEDELSALESATVVTGGSITEAELDRTSELQYFACSSAGYEHLPLDALADAGVAVTNAAGVHAPNVSEYVLGALLSFERRFFEARSRQERREWRSYNATELAGSRVVVVGMGAIGQAILERLAPFDVETVSVRYSPEKDTPADEVYGYDDIEAAAADADAIALACPLSEETTALVDREVLANLDPDATVVNVARGPVVDTDALVRALRKNAIGGAALDVTDPEPLPSEHDLWGFDNVLITPHNAGHTPAYFERLADIVTENIERASTSGEWTGLRNQVLP